MNTPSGTGAWPYEVGAELETPAQLAYARASLAAQHDARASEACSVADRIRQAAERELGVEGGLGRPSRQWRRLMCAADWDVAQLGYLVLASDAVVDPAGLCGAESEPDRDSSRWTCDRPSGHAPGQHVALAEPDPDPRLGRLPDPGLGRTLLEVVEVWPVSPVHPTGRLVLTGPEHYDLAQQTGQDAARAAEGGVTAEATFVLGLAQLHATLALAAATAMAAYGRMRVYDSEACETVAGTPRPSTSDGA